MKYLFLLFLFISINSFSQHDTIRGYYPDSTLKFEKVKLNGLIEGHYKKWFSNGNLQMSLFYKNGVQNGISYYYFNTGHLQSKYNYKNGEMRRYIMFHENGNKMAISKMKGCYLKSKEWNKEGRLISKIRSKNEVSCMALMPIEKDSLFKPVVSCSCGNIEIIFKDGKYLNIKGNEFTSKKRFKKTFYFDNGQMMVYTKYRFGKGIEKKWDKQGNLVKESKL